MLSCHHCCRRLLSESIKKAETKTTYQRLSWLACVAFQQPQLIDMFSPLLLISCSPFSSSCHIKMMIFAKQKKGLSYPPTQPHTRLLLTQENGVVWWKPASSEKIGCRQAPYFPPQADNCSIFSSNLPLRRSHRWADRNFSTQWGDAGESIVLKFASLWHFDALKFFSLFCLSRFLYVVCIRLVYQISQRSCFKSVEIQTCLCILVGCAQPSSHVFFTSPRYTRALAWLLLCTHSIRTFRVSSGQSWTAKPVDCYWFHDYRPCFAGS